ncbi:RNA-dependent RNA polymerase 6-like [Rhodamnia argentea]|uniref:RNA-dependent RNA polymerase n=1 Tax=Rhodamnia argentea TaxID=178133 RepID=A0A8B8QP75_9MYRT|nr:RNA-dependent RNA polymerase 6-like [Rhodamnia argentea]
MESKGARKDVVMTQVTVSGFDQNVTAKELVKYLENTVGPIRRCRLKTSWMPRDSYPDFEVTRFDTIQIVDEYRKVEPHAFVHFAAPEAATSAYELSVNNGLFLNNKPLKVSLGPESPFHMNQRRRTTTPLKLPDVHLEIGNLITPEEFLVGWRGPSSGVDFFVDPFDSMCRFCFTRKTAFSFKDLPTYAVINCEFKMEFLVRDINEINCYRKMSSIVLFLQLASPPRVFFRTADDDIEVTVPLDLLDDQDPWIRTTDFTSSGAVGRCNTYRVSVPPCHGLKLKKAMNYFREQRVQECPPGQFLMIQDEPDFGRPMLDAFFSIHLKGIDFDVMFLLNAVIHKNVFSQHQLSENFYGLLKSQLKEVNNAALKHICSYKRPVFDAYKSLKLVQEWLLKNPKLLKNQKESNDIVEIRRLAITPTKAHCLPPEVELSNRVLRKYKDVADRFLRVTFMDEGLQTMNANVLSYYVAPILKDIKSISFSQKTNIFRRVRMIMTDGFYLCGRKYSFLAFSSNQLRDRSAWFFAEDKEIDVNKIKAWMGKFNNRNTAKCAARMGQCFSSTYATVEVPQNKVNHNLPDIERNGYCFSDGIGTITPDLAREVAEKLKLELDTPSAYQIRYAGYKGVVACWPSKGDGIRLSLRPSMNKFRSNHTTLEICSWTRFQPGFLNRQIVTLLSTLKVPDEVFWDMQDKMVFKLNQMLVDSDVAFDVLTSSCAEQGNIAAIMLSAGFRPQSEPHLRGMLMCIRAAQLWGLREKARIFVPSGRWLMGCFDELGVLEQGQCFIQVSSPALENCFIKHGSRFSETKKIRQVIKGYVVVAKNPCLHPGDVRILQAVDTPKLHHLYDCLVFPQNGERPHTNEASGSDLDGDLYFVTWEENLIPPSKESWTPMQYDPAEEKKLPRDVTQKDIIEFFVKHFLNENLGAICNAHVVHADRSEHGALDENCILLAELAATAVDFPKTGKLVTMPYHLKPKQYPDFMGKEEFQTYKSNKILGRLYRQIKDAYDEDLNSSELNCDSEDIPYDTSLEVLGAVDFISNAWDHKCSYDGQLSGLLGQYKVNNEEELVTGHVWSMPKNASRKRGELKERLKHSYTALRREFREIFKTLDSDSESLSDEERNLLYEQKASAWYQVTYHPEWVKKSVDLREHDDGCTGALKLSFAWIAADFLARIKIRKQKGKNLKPIESLSKYIADRI